MTLKRYARTAVLNFGRQYGTSYSGVVIREGMKQGRIRSERLYLKEQERLDVLAGRVYGDGRLWWLICAASNIGWCPQVPPYTEIFVPNIEDVSRLLG